MQDVYIKIERGCSTDFMWISKPDPGVQTKLGEKRSGSMFFFLKPGPNTWILIRKVNFSFSIYSLTLNSPLAQYYHEQRLPRRPWVKFKTEELRTLLRIGQST